MEKKKRRADGSSDHALPAAKLQPRDPPVAKGESELCLCSTRGQAGGTQDHCGSHTSNGNEEGKGETKAGFPENPLLFSVAAYASG